MTRTEALAEAETKAKRQPGETFVAFRARNGRWLAGRLIGTRENPSYFAYGTPTFFKVDATAATMPGSGDIHAFVTELLTVKENDQGDEGRGARRALRRVLKFIETGDTK